MGDRLGDAKTAYERSDWSEALTAYSEADAISPLDVDELERASLSAMWLGDVAACIDFAQRGFTLCSAGGNNEHAGGMALELCLLNAVRGNHTVALGWAERAGRLLEGAAPCPELGRFRELQAGAAMEIEGNPEAALVLYDEVAAIGLACNDRDLIAAAHIGKGTIFVRQGRVAEGMRLVDEAMLDAVTGQLGSVRTARVYCGTISLCQALGDLRRASEWTEEAITCSARPGMGDYPGDCRMHRAEIMRLRGDWSGAESELLETMDALAKWSNGHVGQAWYELGEIALRRNDLAAASDAFTRAAAEGKEPQPGLAMLRLLEGECSAASALLRTALATTSDTDPLRIAQLLPALVRTQLACGDIEGARDAVARLAEIASVYGTVLLDAEVATCGTLIASATGALDDALALGRRAGGLWRDGGAPYEAAQAQQLVAEAALRAGDPHVATVEIDTAISVFEGLGASRDLASARALRSRLRDAPDGGRVRRTFMFTDVVDSTRMLTAMGDESWSGVLRWHDRTIRGLLSSHGGTEVKQRGGGDGFFAVFPAADAGVSCAVAIQRAFAEHRGTQGFAPEVRIGVHEADALLCDDDYAGLGVHEAARIAGVAGGGEILTSETTATAAGAAAEAPRLVDLKGLAEPVSVQLVVWRQS